MAEQRFKIFFTALYITAFMPYLPSVIPFLPGQLFGFNVTGWAWISMLFITLLYLPYVRLITFPVWLWLPWMIYIVGYLVIDFSLMGLQLTLQYILPLLVGIVASDFAYTSQRLKWIGNQLKILTIVVAVLALFYKLVFGYSPAMASTPMLLAIGASIAMAFYFFTKKLKYATFFLFLFLMPFLNVTRMGIAVFLAIGILHFANHNLTGKITYGLIGILAVILVFNSRGFQEKTFYGGSGSISDLTLNYYETSQINSSGRSSWKNAMEPGLERAPVWGNGPRSDAYVLGAVIDKEFGEAHNDYLSVRYNYGWVGLSLLLFGFAASFMAVYRQFRSSYSGFQFMLTSSLLTLFIVFLMFMYSDNILKYTITFPNLFFAMMGISFSMHKTNHYRVVLEMRDRIRKQIQYSYAR